MACSRVTFSIVCAVVSALSLRAETKRNSKDGLTYAWIFSGTYTMGCSLGDGECFDWEAPPHNVAVKKGFWIGQTEVTQRAYEKVMGTNPSRYRGPNLPVEQVSWFDALRYCEEVGMRLPSEIEWEYAARGGTRGPLYDLGPPQK